MNKICVALLVLALREPQSEQKLTKKSIEDAAKDLKGVEIALWDHAGVKSEGSSTIIGADGAVVQSWKAWYPLTPEEKTATRKLRLALPLDDVRRIVRLFASDDILALPKVREDLVGVREMRYTVALKVSGSGSFEGEHPNLEFSKLPKVPAAKYLIQAIRKSVDELRDRITAEDADLLKQKRLAALTEGFLLELHDIQGLWGGSSVRVHADGRIEGVSVRVPKQGEQGMQTRPFKGVLEKGRVAAILKNAAELGTFDLKPKREYGIPDEGRPVLVVEATIDGATYSRSVALWEGEVRETPAFLQIRKALQDIAAEQLK